MCSVFVSLHGTQTLVICPIVVYIPVYLSGLCMMSVPREKISKDKQGLIARVKVRFARDPSRFQLLFLSDTDKS